MTEKVREELKIAKSLVERKQMNESDLAIWWRQVRDQTYVATHNDKENHDVWLIVKRVCSDVIGENAIE